MLGYLHSIVALHLFTGLATAALNSKLLPINTPRLSHNQSFFKSLFKLSFGITQSVDHGGIGGASTQYHHLPFLTPALYFRSSPLPSNAWPGPWQLDKVDLGCLMVWSFRLFIGWWMVCFLDMDGMEDFYRVFDRKWMGLCIQ